MELDTIWKDRGIRKYLKMKLVKALILQVITFGAEGWNLKKNDETRSRTLGVYVHFVSTRAYWMNFKQEAQIIKRQMAYFGHACRNNSN